MPTGVKTGSKQPLWTAERDLAAEHHLKDGLSYSQVADKLGGVSRSACLSRARRMGYAPHGGKPEAGREKRPTRAKASTPRVVASKAAPAPVPVAIDEHMSPSQKKVAIVKAMAAVTPPARLTPHPTRTARQCKMPIGDPKLADFRWCENAAEPDGWCADCHKIVYPGTKTVLRERAREQREHFGPKFGAGFVDASFDAG